MKDIRFLEGVKEYKWVCKYYFR